MQAMAILVGVDGNTANAHGLEGANGANRDFAPVGDQYFREHGLESPVNPGSEERFLLTPFLNFEVGVR